MSDERSPANLPTTQPITLNLAAEALKTFLEQNPSATLAEDPKGILVKTPWGDPSLAFRLPTQPDTLIASLNRLVLPERLSAVWHRENRQLEVIWTALRLSPSQAELVGRVFDFSYRGQIHTCRFGQSSADLLAIAASVRPQGTSNTDYRNMQSYSFYTTLETDQRPSFALDQPRSFWVDNVDWNESYVLELVSSLNFYLLYFDSMSPFILVHEPPAEPASILNKIRYVHGDFPTQISGRYLNPNLTSYFAAANTADPMMKFILYYRIVEYAAHAHIETEIRTELAKLLATPHLAARMPDAIDRISELFGGRMDDIPRFKSLFRKAVDPRLLWAEIQANKKSFLDETVFDGGFRLRALIHEKESEEQFKQKGTDFLCDQIRRIRNALAHGRDQESGTAITPTTRNLQLLRPWNHVMEAAAAEVVLFMDVV